MIANSVFPQTRSFSDSSSLPPVPLKLHIRKPAKQISKHSPKGISPHYSFSAASLLSTAVPTPIKKSFAERMGLSPLSLSILSEDPKVPEPVLGGKVTSVSNFADTNEAGIYYGVTLKKGAFRNANEDRVFLRSSFIDFFQFLAQACFGGKLGNFFAAVFDGHGGDGSAQYLMENCGQKIEQEMEKEQEKFWECSLERVFEKAFLELDAELKAMAEKNAMSITDGSTAIMLLLLNNFLHLAYVGDSAALLIRDNSKSYVELCPEIDTANTNKKEVERIEKAGGFILKLGKTLRLQGELAVTRSLGDYKYKGLIIPQPHYISLELKPNDKNEYLILASDGLWKSVKNEEILEIVAKHKTKNENEIAELLHDKARERGSTDNVTIIVVNLMKRHEIG